MVFQDYTSFDHRSVLDNITFGLECKRVSRRERNDLGRQWMKHVGLNVGKDAEKYPHELSGGMRQRVAIARTLILRPKIILMDEPFGALDEFTREAMNLELSRLAAEAGVTVIFVTHNIQEAVFLADRVVVMTPRPGRVARTFDVPLPRPRTVAARADPVFGALALAIHETLTAAR